MVHCFTMPNCGDSDAEVVTQDGVELMFTGMAPTFDRGDSLDLTSAAYEREHVTAHGEVSPRVVKHRGATTPKHEERSGIGTASRNG